MRRLRTFTGLFLLVPLAAVVLPAETADAANRAAASVTFSGNATLPTFPCVGTCNGSFAGTVSGEGAGDNNGNPWTLTLAQNAVSASFTYSDAFLHCAVGVTTSASISMSAAAGGTFGTYGAGPLPNPVTNFTLSANFVWIRVGTTAFLTLTNVNLVLTVDPVGAPLPFNRTVINGGAGDATAVFVPIPSGAVPDCVNLVPAPITGLVAGSGEVHDIS